MPICADIPAGSKKRRRSNETRASKFYAVKAGAKPGIYGTWEECQEQIVGFKGACFKAFSNHKDAQDFVAGNTVKKKSESRKAERFYGVAAGHRPGVYTDWAEASLQIKDVKRPKFKKFLTREEAEYFVFTNGEELQHISGEEEQEEKDLPTEADELISNKRRKTGALLDRSKESEENFIKVYTDGSSRRNGRLGARAGVGVFFGTNDPRNVSEPLQGQAQTNQRAELTAVLRALQICPMEKDVQIVTDSTYTINCVTKWYQTWLKNEWKTSNGSRVLNKDLVQSIRVLMDRRKHLGAKTALAWVRGHNHDSGNDAADRLAVAGSSNSYRSLEYTKAPEKRGALADIN
ncbi:Ribonuclease H [Golovinomyces cichoracearum]|uniref:Ribonuclease H n=1 Tax=Golovinomyces cichoracearum TaxID=62708 RepID=A0A420I7S1_9PEZI|nr:Ribonuclease H [Golovinomyces cichoracearum]